MTPRSRAERLKLLHLSGEGGGAGAAPTFLNAACNTMQRLRGAAAGEVVGPKERKNEKENKINIRIINYFNLNKKLHKTEKQQENKTKTTTKTK